MPSCQHSRRGWCPLEGMANRSLKISFLSDSHSYLVGVYLACLEVLVPPTPQCNSKVQVAKTLPDPFPAFRGINGPQW